MADIYEDLKLLKSLFDTFLINDIEQECVEYEAEQVHEIVERMLTVLEQHDETIHIFGELCARFLDEVDNDE